MSLSFPLVDFCVGFSFCCSPFSEVTLFLAGQAQENFYLLETKMATYDEEFLDLLCQLQLPEDVRHALVQNGYDCTLTFGPAFSSMQMLDQHIQKFLPLGETDTTSPICARIRALWSKCKNLHTSSPITPAQQFPPTPSATPCASQINEASNWHETLPPKLSTDDMETMRIQFGKNYPGQVLDAHSTPSIRLWSLVHQQKVHKYIKYIPIQLRLSEHQYSAMIEARSSKPLRSEIQLLSQLCWIPRTWTSIQSVSQEIGSTEHPLFSETPAPFVECAIYKSSKPLTPRSVSILFPNLTVSWD